MELLDMLSMAVWIQQAVGEKLLTPSARLRADHGDFLAGEGRRGIARILHSPDAVAGVPRALALEGQGADFSFFDPDRKAGAYAHLRAFRGTVFMGRGTDFVDARAWLPLSGVGVRELEREPPSSLGGQRLAIWRELWRDDFAERDRDVLKGATVGIQPKPGRTVLARLQDSFGEDFLVGLEFLEQDDYGWTFLWRELERFRTEMIGELGPKDPEGGVVIGKAPPGYREQLMALTVPELLEGLQLLRVDGEAKLTAVSAETKAAWDARVARHGRGVAGAGITRLLSGPDCSALMTDGSTGASVTFLTGSRSDRTPDVTFDGERLWAGTNSAATGLVVDLGPVPDELLRALLDSRFDGLDADAGDAVDVLLDLEVEIGRRGARGWPQGWERPPMDLGVGHFTELIPGHAYLIRTATGGTGDRLILATALELDEMGCVIGWHVLEQYGG